MTMRALAAVTLVMACMACEPAPASTPPGAAVRRVMHAPEPRRDEVIQRGQARVRFELRMDAGPQWPIPLEWLTLWFRGDSGSQTIAGADLMAAQAGVFRSPWYITDRRGRFQIDVMVQDPDSTMMSFRTFELTLDDGESWKVSLVVSAVHREMACVESFDMAGTFASTHGAGKWILGCLEPDAAP